MKHTLPTLTYAYAALEPYMDARTMEIHHTKHHQAYIDKLNAALEDYPELAQKSIESLVENIADIPESIRTAVRNHGGGHANQHFSASILRPAQGRDNEPSGNMRAAIDKNFGILIIQDQFTQAAIGQFGSAGHAVKDKIGALTVEASANSDISTYGAKTHLLVLMSGSIILS
jgi:Fe-Mn family superoxide dismutase